MGIAISFRASAARSTARVMPLRISRGCTPAARDFRPSISMALAKITAVVVPSPTLSFVFDATSLSTLAPMFSNGSGSSTSLETVTPSLVEWGFEYFFSRTTFLPVGPRVTLTTRARVSIPSASFRRALAL